MASAKQIDRATELLRTNGGLGVSVIIPKRLYVSGDGARADKTLRNFGITHILSLQEHEERQHHGDRPKDIAERGLRMADNKNTRLAEYLPDCIDFIDEALGSSDEAAVLVHCTMGMSRSPSVVIAWLMSSRGLTFDEAYARVKKARPVICPNPAFLDTLRQWKGGDTGE